MKTSKFLQLIVLGFLLLIDNRVYSQNLKSWKYSNLLTFQAPEDCKLVKKSINELSLADNDFGVKLVFDKSLTKIKQSSNSADKSTELSSYLDKLTENLGFSKEMEGSSLALEGFNACYQKVKNVDGNYLIGVMFDKVFSIDFYFVISYTPSNELLAENVMNSFAAIDYGF